uniref:Uncharacterized protein n=1 Tax=Caenorhabditis japonica TaxID=281687 RepID=A0A8R1HNE7_CAEJA
MGGRRRLNSSTPTVDHRVFSMYSLAISFIYMLRIAFDLFTQIGDESDVQWHVTECLFVVFGILISIALHNAYDTRLSLISISWTVWMFINTILALFVVNSDIIQLYFICVFLVSSNPQKSRRQRKSQRQKNGQKLEKPIVKKQFEVANVFLSDEMVYYV